MNETGQAFSKDVTVVNELGLHARSAGKIAKLAGDAVSKVWVQKDEERVDAGSILDILTLACEKGLENKTECRTTRNRVSLY